MSDDEFKTVSVRLLDIRDLQAWFVSGFGLPMGGREQQAWFAMGAEVIERVANDYTSAD